MDPSATRPAKEPWFTELFDAFCTMQAFVTRDAAHKVAQTLVDTWWDEVRGWPTEQAFVLGTKEDLVQVRPLSFFCICSAAFLVCLHALLGS